MRHMKISCRKCCTWKGVQWQIWVSKQTSADHDGIKDIGLLLPFTQSDYVPLAGDSEIWAFSYTAHFSLKKNHRRHDE